jgi:hypothetical protein
MLPVCSVKKKVLCWAFSWGIYRALATGQLICEDVVVMKFNSASRVIEGKIQRFYDYSFPRAPQVDLLKEAVVEILIPTTS